ncbi:MAG: hypothetical protein M4579_001114 [Chaenotheca gracillima]|nr:MAG: hypothetical protein M4579_001114 [Chaenotheca gracillima]
MSVLTRTIDDARRIWWCCEDYDEDDVYAKFMPTRPRAIHAVGPQSTKFRFGVPPAYALDQCDPVYRKKFAEAVEYLKSIDGEPAPIDWEPFEKGGELLYHRSFVSERIAALPDGWLEKNREHLHPVIRELFERVTARQSTAIDAYRDLMAKAQYTRQIEKAFRAGPGGIDILVVPSCPIQWTIEEVHADPIGSNMHLGYFAHFANVLDMAAIALPAGTYSVGDLGKRIPQGADAASLASQLPFSVTILGLCGTDSDLFKIAKRFEKAVASR